MRKENSMSLEELIEEISDIKKRLISFGQNLRQCNEIDEETFTRLATHQWRACDDIAWIGGGLLIKLKSKE